MTIEQAKTIVDDLQANEKASGSLIKPGDWNSMVDAMDHLLNALQDTNDIVATLQADVGNLQTDMTTVKDGLTTLRADHDDLNASLQPVLNQYLVTTRCSRLRYALGELCEITAEVTDLQGGAVSERPWIDFVSSWGRLRPVAGFQSRGGVGDNSLSVRTDGNGIARVMLRAEHTEGFSESEEQQVASALNTQVAVSQLTIADTLLQASSPTDSFAVAAFNALTVEYERTDSIAIQAYADTWHQRTPSWYLTPSRPSFFNNWRDYRATVMAFAKPDGDPTTADYSRGGSTIQITFRDWLFNWANRYVLDTNVLEAGFVGQLNPIFQANNNYINLLDNVQTFVSNAVANKGILGRQRILGAQAKALGSITPQGNDPYINVLKTQMQGAVANQQIMENVQTADIARSLPMMQVLMGTTMQSSQIKGEVSSLGQEVQAQADLRESVSVLEGRMQSTETMGARIETGLSKMIEDVSNINVLDETSIQSGLQKLNSEFLLIKSGLNI